MAFPATALGEPTNTSPPYVEGSPVSGETLSANPGSWQSEGDPAGTCCTFSYSWERNGTAVSTNASYQLTDADVGSLLCVRVTAVAPSGPTPHTAVCAYQRTRYAFPTNVSLPTVSGNPAPGETLTLSDGSWQITSGSGPLLFSYSWYFCPDDYGDCESARTKSWVVPAGSWGKDLYWSVFACIPDGIGGTTSCGDARGTVRVAAAPPPPPPPPPTVQSNIKAGQTLKGTVTWVITAPTGTKSVEFFRSRDQLHVDETSPFAFSLDTTKFPNGTTHLGMAFTTSDNVRRTQQVGNVTINNPVKEPEKPPAGGGGGGGGSNPTGGGSGGSNSTGVPAANLVGIPALRPPAVQPRPIIPGESLLRVGTFAKTGKIARVAKRWGVAMFVVERETGEILRSGRVTCLAVAAEKKLKTRFQGFHRGAAGCSWRIPQWAQGRPLVGSITVRSSGMKLTKTFSAKVR
jgi:hypothetical protein